jgi:hypothetical protein
LTVSGPWIGLLYASEPERDREPDHASSLARRYRRDEVVVIDSAQLGGKPVVFGTMYRRDGHVVRAAWTPVDGDERKLRALGRFIADGILAPGLHGGRPSNARDGASLSDEWDDKPLPSWPFIAGGMVAVGVGIGLIAIDQDYGHLDAHGVRTAYYWNTAPWGVAAGITGAASIGFGLWWWTRHHSPAPNLSAGRSHVSLGLSGTY